MACLVSLTSLKHSSDSLCFDIVSFLLFNTFCGMIKICYVLWCSSPNPGSRVGYLHQGSQELHQEDFSIFHFQVNERVSHDSVDNPKWIDSSFSGCARARLSIECLCASMLIRKVQNHSLICVRKVACIVGYWISNLLAIYYNGTISSTGLSRRILRLTFWKQEKLVFLSVPEVISRNYFHNGVFNKHIY